MNTLFENQSTIHLENIAFYGRTLEEYLEIFDLNLASLRGKRVLDTASGSASFAAEAAREGVDVVATDPLYDRSAEALGRLGTMDIENVIARAKDAEHQFVFSYYKDMDQVQRSRYRAIKNFVEDYAYGRAVGRYQTATLPHLPFGDNSFDTVLNGHFLFLYAERLGDAFVFNAVSELLRVASRSVCIYPLIQLNGYEYPLMGELLKEVAQQGITAKVCPLKYEFFKGANYSLRLEKL